MKLERTLFKISISEIIILSILMLVVLNGLILLLYLIIGKPRLLIYDTSWIIQIVFPFIYSIIQNSINRNGALKLSGYNDLTKVTKQLESFIMKRGYVALGLESGDIKYVKKTKWSRFFSHFFKENINVRVTENEILIFAKRNLLVPIELMFKYDKTI